MLHVHRLMLCCSLRVRAMSIGLNIAPLVAVVLALVQLSHAEYSTQGYFTTVFAGGHT